MSDIFTDCRTNEGVAVGLIDGIIAMARVLRDLNNQASHDGEYSEAVEQALRDLRQDEDIKWLMGCENAMPKINFNDKYKNN